MTSPDKAVPTGSFQLSTDGTNGLGGLTDGRSAAYSGDPNTVQNYTNQTFHAMTSGAVNSLAQRSNASLGNFVGSATDEMLAGLCRALAGIDVLGIEPFAFLNGWASDLDAQARQAITTASTAQATSTANASAITVLQTQQQQSQVGGSSITDNFQSWNTANWTSSKTGAVADMTVVGGQAGIGKQGDTASGNVVALWNTPLQTDSESVSVVLGNANQAANVYASGSIIRAATDLSSFVFASISAGGLILGNGTRSAGSTTFNEWTSYTGGSISTGDTITLAATGSTYTVSVNGVALLSYSDTAGAVPIGAANRFVGFVSAYAQQSTIWGTSGYFGFDLASFTASDTASPQQVGTGWSIYRQSTGSVAQPVTGTLASRLAPGTFDQVRPTTNNVNVVDPGTGSVQVAKSGWYVISVGLQWDTAAGGNPYWTSVYTAPNTSGPWTLQRTGGENYGSAIYSTTDTFVLFLPAGSLVSPGYFTANNAGIRGDAAGIATFFDGTLCSFS